MQSPRASADATSVSTLSPGWARPGASPRSRCRSTSCGRPRCRASVAGRIRPALLTRRWSSKAIWMWSGWSSGSIFWVLLVSGWISLSKTIITDAQEHFLTPSARRHTHIFGGLGIRREGRSRQINPRCKCAADWQKFVRRTARSSKTVCWPCPRNASFVAGSTPVSTE